MNLNYYNEFDWLEWIWIITINSNVNDYDEFAWLVQQPFRIFIMKIIHKVTDDCIFKE